MESAEIRRRFLDFFAERGHTVVPSASLILDDPTLLFVNAGMVPFKPFFLGEAVPPYQRATSVQKVVRTLDIEEVGKTTRHGTFFQMNGNFSFGDYFKEGAIQHAWQLVTNRVDAGGFGFDGDRIWVTCHVSDDEAEQIWIDDVGFPSDRLQRLDKDNFWEMGETGPCGPSSEIFFDYGSGVGPGGGPANPEAEDRYVEIWNLVFQQYFRNSDGSLIDLPTKNIDTGAGLERILAS